MEEQKNDPSLSTEVENLSQTSQSNDNRPPQNEDSPQTSQSNDDRLPLDERRPCNNFKLPAFWKHNAGSWIALIEAKFRMSKITTQINKYMAILEALSNSELEHLYNIPKPEDENCYDKLITQTPIKRYPPPTQAFEELNLDLIGPLPPSRGYRHILTITDRFTKGCFAIALPDTKSDTIATYFMNQYVSLFGVPRMIVTDNAAYFTSYSWSKFMTFLNVNHKFITPYHSQSNGMVERFNRFLRTALRCHKNSDAWFDHLGLALLGINASYNSDIKMSRAERLFGKRLRLPCAFFDESASKPAFDDPSMLKTLMEFFNDRKPAPINTHTNHRSVHVDKRFQTCSAVYLRVDRVKKGLEPSYTGPFKVVKKFDKYFTIETSHGTKNVSFDRLKPAYIADVFDQVDCNNTKTNQSSFFK